MRIRVLSDLHLEFGPFDPPAAEADVVVLAGDTDRGLRGSGWARSAFPGVPVLYVAGNHEYYTKALPKLTNELRTQSDGMRFLEQECAEIGGVRFFGCTLWTDFQLLGSLPLARDTAQLRMNDYRKIRRSPDYRRLRPSDTASIHSQSRRWLEQAIADGLTRNAVIITHHAPSALSLAAEEDTDWRSPAYASNLDELVEASEAALWIHGHTHCCVDYHIGRTRVLSNPRGYVDQPAQGFDPALVVNLPG